MNRGHLKDSSDEAGHVDTSSSTYDQDEKDIRRMGKISQFKVRNDFYTILSSGAALK